MADYIGHNFYIKPTYIVALPEFSGGFGGRSKAQVKNEANLKDNKAKGNLSAKSERKLKNAVNWLCSSAKNKWLWSKKHQKAFTFKINFITLTFPYNGKENITEKQAKRCVHAFLSYSRKYFYLRNYIWKLEKTEKNQLHCHLTTDTFIDYRKLRKQWNNILKREVLLDEYFNREGHYNANSTDVHAVHKVKDIAAYISKYMSKSATTMSDFKGRIWACNKEISEANSCQAFVARNSDDRGVRKLYSPETDYKPIMSAPDAFGNNKQIGELFFMNEKLWQQLQKSIIRETYDAHRFHIRNNIEKMPPEYWDSFVNDFFDNNLKTKTNEKTIPPGKPLDRSVREPLQSKPIKRSNDYQTTFEEMLH